MLGQLQMSWTSRSLAGSRAAAYFAQWRSASPISPGLLRGAIAQAKTYAGRRLSAESATLPICLAATVCPKEMFANMNAYSVIFP